MPHRPSILTSFECSREHAVAIVALAAGGILLTVSLAAGGAFRIPAWALIGTGLSWLGGWRLGTVFAVLAAMYEGLTGLQAGGVTGTLGDAMSLAVVLVIIAVAVANWQKAREVAIRNAATDDLTGLLNRRGFRRAVETEISRAGRTGRGFAIAFLDCDRFKVINDSLGHHAGDEALRQMAKTLRQQTRGYDAVARLGGDEFGVLLPETTLESALEIVRRLQQAVVRTSADRRLRMSAGLVWTADGGTYDDLLAQADRELLAAKRAGGSGLSWRTGAPREESVGASIER